MPQLQKRKISPQEEARLLYKLAGAYLLGAALSVALSFLPLLRGDGRDMGLAARLSFSVRLLGRTLTNHKRFPTAQVSNAACSL